MAQSTVAAEGGEEVVICRCSHQRLIRITLSVVLLTVGSVLPIFLSADLSADICDSSILESVNKRAALAYRRFPNRCEGFYSAKVSNQAFRVVGFTVGRFTYSMDAAEIIRISAFHHKKQPIRIQAHAIQIKTHYRMDTVIDNNQALVWPIKDIILNRPDELASGNIAVIGWIESNKEKIFVPLSVASSVTNPGQDRSPCICVSASSDLADFQWRLILPAGKGGNTPVKWQDPKGGKRLVRTGHPIFIELPGQVSGLMVVEMAARIKDTIGWTTDSIHVDLGDAQW